MTTLLIVLCGAAVFSMIFASRPHFVILAAFALFALVPSIAVGTVVPLPVHPGLFMIAAGAAVQFLRSPRRFLQVLNSRPLLACLVLLLSALMLFIRWSTGYGMSLGGVLSIAIGPFLLYVLTLLSFSGAPGPLRTLLRGFAVLTLIVIGVAGAQYFTGDVYVWESAYQQQWWWGSRQEITQPVATFGHWIPMAVFLAVILPLTTLLKSRLLWIFMIVLSLATVLASASRAGLILLVIASVFVAGREMRANTAHRNMALLILSLPLGALVVSLVRSELSETLSSKVEDDGVSTELRLQAIDWFFSHMGDFAVSPYPVSDLLAAGILGSSLENGFFIFATGYSVLTASVLAMVCITLVVSVVSSRGTHRFTAAVVILLFLASTVFSGSFASGSAFEYMLAWMAAALGTVEFPGSEQKPRTEAADTPAVPDASCEAAPTGSPISAAPPSPASGEAGRRVPEEYGRQ
ncbi:hypothetical protein [Brevibacterium album]|uniref:hypothetical protein n=1 Tax=Brevibacterium album TaxID=417948 RepID=UPI00042556E5|nr:hypothetical protein [Brevibacterium album]